ncbi:MAG: hypothetical protein IH623_19730 [Verrucomicrobia bacterium]|nr:hypothetical protein [Verrucomicrobiota bacterium]
MNRKKKKHPKQISGSDASVSKGSKSGPVEPSLGKDKQAMSAATNPLALWERSVAYHRYMAEWYYFQPWEGVTALHLRDFAMYGELVAQSYLCALRKAVPAPRKNGIPVGYFEKLLLAHVRRLNDMLCELAREGHWGANNELWDQALKLTETFSELALQNPAVFRGKARRSLFMPSVRTRNPRFTADAAEIAVAIELSAESIGGKLTDNRVRLGALCARLVAECVHEIKLARDAWADLSAWDQHEVIWPTQEQVQRLMGKSIDDILGTRKEGINQNAHDGDELGSHLELFCMFAECGVARLHFLTLPELTAAAAPLWWKGAIEKMVEARFPKLLEIPSWLECLQAVSTGTKPDMLKELKDYSRDKVKQFA